VVREIARDVIDLANHGFYFVFGKFTYLDKPNYTNITKEIIN
jgi:hypothetical protein